MEFLHVFLNCKYIIFSELVFETVTSVAYLVNNWFIKPKLMVNSGIGFVFIFYCYFFFNAVSFLPISNKIASINIPGFSNSWKYCILRKQSLYPMSEFFETNYV